MLEPNRHISSMLENWEVHGFKQRFLFSFSLSNLSIPKPQLRVSVCKEGISQGSMHTDLPYPSADNFWCKELCKVRKCQNLSQMVSFTAVHCCGCLPSQTRRSCQCMTQLFSLESRVAPGVVSISKLWFWGHAEGNTEKQWRTSEWNLNDIHNYAWPY